MKTLNDSLKESFEILLENISRKRYGQRKSIHVTLKAVTKGAAIM